MPRFTYTPTVPGESFEYRVAVAGRPIVGLVRKQLATHHPYHPTGKWEAQHIDIITRNHRSRDAAAEWLLSWLSNRV